MRLAAVVIPSWGGAGGVTDAQLKPTRSSSAVSLAGLVVLLPAVPSFSIALNGANVILSWSTSQSAGYIMQCNLDLDDSGTGEPVEEDVVVEGATNTVMDAYSNQRVLRDLLDNCPQGAPGTNRHSYEVRGEVRTVNKVTQQFCNSYALQYHPTLKGTKPGPSGFWLYHDGDDAGANNKWDGPDNHGALGGNVTYCDGHAACVPTRQRATQWMITRDSTTPP
ncbi:MAG TPA: hypothetical protein PKI20_14075 [Verrucomicrobiota bacterium]|nr:hypothetical protein [Verrucomicrobiota bacterium]